MSRVLRVAMTFEQAWHRVPGGTAVAANKMATALDARPSLDVVGVSARHRSDPPRPWAPPVEVHSLPWPRLALYESWHRLRWPKVQQATGPVDLIHATAVALPPRSAPLVVTIHDLAWLKDSSHFTRRGLSFFTRGFSLALRDADLVLCSSRATMHDCEAAGFTRDRLRHVPLGVDMLPAAATDIEDVRARYGLEGPYALWIGTVEPRKNLRRLLEAFMSLDRDIDLVLAGPKGWKEDLSSLIRDKQDRIKVLGFVPAEDLPPLYAGAEVFCSPSLLEGFGFPVLEAMTQGTPVVTSRGTSTEELAHDAGVLVEPRDSRSIAEGIESVLGHDVFAAKLAEAGRRRAAEYTWARTADLVEAAYRDVVRPASRVAGGGSDARKSRTGPGRRRSGGSGAPRSGSTGPVRSTRVGINLLWMVPGSVGGSESYLARLLVGLAERGSRYDYTLFVLPAFATSHPELAASFRTVAAPVTGTRKSVRVAAENSWLAAHCRKRGIQLVHHAGGIVPLLHPGAVVLTIHDLQYLHYPNYFSQAKLAYLRAMVPRSASHAEVVVTPSRFSAMDVVDKLDVHPDSVCVVPHGISLRQRTAEDAEVARHVRERYGLPGPFFLYPAITYPHKNHAVLLEALAQLLRRDAGATLVLTGATGSVETDITRHARRLGIAEQTRRLGHVRAGHLDGLYDEAVAMTFPSRFEGFGAPVLEAMSRGCPVLAADTTALPEVVGEAGCLLPPDDITAWAEAMHEVLVDEGLRSKLSAAGIERARSFSWTHSAQLLEESYGLAIEAPA